jgi:predicted metal-dependent HD superfamily phosphohydrolase
MSAASSVEAEVGSTWFSLMSALQVSDAVSARWWERVRVHYCEPQRHYHTLVHVQQMLVLAAAHRECLAHPEHVQLAIFFHEYVNHSREHVENDLRL